MLPPLRHPKIAPIYGLEKDREARALLMQSVPGNTLKTPFPLEIARLHHYVTLRRTGKVASSGRWQKLTFRILALSCSPVRAAVE